jgi:hypothetical protein
MSEGKRASLARQPGPVGTLRFGSDPERATIARLRRARSTYRVHPLGLGCFERVLGWHLTPARSEVLVPPFEPREAVHLVEGLVHRLSVGSGVAGAAVRRCDTPRAYAVIHG